jgi:Flp pilus assembly protein TadG
MRSRRRGSERGAAAVEFALILIPLLFILMGTIDWGYHFFLREIVTNAAREGARAGAISATPGAQTVAQNYLTRVGFDATTVAGAVTDCSSSTPNAVCVQIDYPIPNNGSISGFLSQFVSMPTTASARAVMRQEY